MKIKKWHIIVVVLLIVLGIGMFFGWKAAGGAILGAIGIGAGQATKNRKTNQNVEQNQKERQEEVDEIVKDKEDRDKRLQQLKNDIKNGPNILIFLIILLLVFPSIGLAQEVPSDYEQLKKLYLKSLDRNTELVQQRDEAIDLAEGYKSDFEKLQSKLEDAETDINTLQERLKETNDILEKQDQIIDKLSGVRIGAMAGFNITPANPENSGILLGGVINF